MEETKVFTNTKQFIAHLETVEGDTLNKQDVIDTLTSIVTRPATSGQRRGQLAGLALEDMTDEQLKREIINAKSVLYKATQRGAAEETINKNQARVDAAMAEKAKRTPEAPAAETADPANEVSEGQSDGVYDAELAEEL